MAHYIDIGQKGPYGWTWASYPSAKGFTAKQQGRSRSAESAVTFHDATASRPWRYNSTEGFYGDASSFQVRTTIPDPVVAPTPPVSVPAPVPVVPVTQPPATAPPTGSAGVHNHWNADPKISHGQFKQRYPGTWASIDRLITDTGRNTKDIEGYGDMVTGNRKAITNLREVVQGHVDHHKNQSDNGGFDPSGIAGMVGQAAGAILPALMPIILLKGMLD